GRCRPHGPAAFNRDGIRRRLQRLLSGEKAMSVKSYRDAINECLHQEMERDPTVIVIGEDVVGGSGTEGGKEAIGGVFSLTAGLWAKYGDQRVMDTPISESAIVGAAAGAALTGMRPVAEIMF